MIKVIKAPQVPISLATTKRYDGEDVKLQLIIDHHNKCYLCERVLVTDFEIEHIDSKGGKQNWDNLFLACRYCNGKKLNNYDDILNPAANDIEEIIQQEIKDNKAVFYSHNCDSTIKLLNAIHNGKSRVRTIKEERFFQYVKSQVNLFSEIVLKYCQDKTVNNKAAITEELSIDKEFLGFKYWIICSNPALKAEFGNDIVWNK